jgi:hypothetical protein
MLSTIPECADDADTLRGGGWSDMPLVCEVGEVQICRSCGCEFGTDETEQCFTCHSYVCPKCGECLCDGIKIRLGGKNAERNYGD